MSIIIFALIVVIVAALAIYAVDQIPVPNPIGAVMRIAIIVVAILVVVQRAGLA